MKITIGQKALETHDTILLEASGEKWHACAYPQRPETLRIRPGDKCEGGCDAKPLPWAKMNLAPVVAPVEPPSGYMPENGFAYSATTNKPETEPPPEFMPGFVTEPAAEPEPVKPSHKKSHR